MNKKDVDFVSGRSGFQIPTPSFLGFNVCEVENKKRQTRENSNKTFVAKVLSLPNKD